MYEEYFAEYNVINNYTISVEKTQELLYLQGVY